MKKLFYLIMLCSGLALFSCQENGESDEQYADGIHLSDFARGFIPVGNEWTILDESATNEDFAGLRALLTEGVEVSLTFPYLKVIPNEAFCGCLASFNFSGLSVERIEDGYVIQDTTSSQESVLSTLYATMNVNELSDDKAIITPDFKSSLSSHIESISSPQFTQENPGDYGAFAYCVNLKSISLPKLTEVGDLAFISCSSLAEISLPEAINIKFGSICGCSKLTKISLPKAITIGNNGLSACTALTEISFPEVKTVDDFGMYGCASLTKVSLPKATTISYCGLGYNEKLVEVSLPKVTTLEANALYWTSLTEISLPEAITIGRYACCASPSLTKVLLPKAIILDTAAFQQCIGLTEVSFPMVTELKNGVFAGCTSLASASLPQASIVGPGAFGKCTSLSSLSLPMATKIEWSAMDGTDSLTELELATGQNCKLESIGENMLTAKNVTLTIGAANSEYITDNTLKLGSYSYTFKEIIIK